MNHAQIDDHLDEVEGLQIHFKSDTVRAIAIQILKAALAKLEFWPDDIDLKAIRDEDRNCIGPLYRRLCLRGIIERGNHFRRTTSADSRGRTIFIYRLIDERKAQIYLRAISPKTLVEVFQLERERA